MRYLFGFVCVCALGIVQLVGCSEGGGEGGSGGSAGTGGEGGGGTGGMPECQNPEDCDDANDCTGNVCADGMCEYSPLADGTACDESNECTTGMCASGECDTTPVQDGTACGNDAGTCQQGSCQVACTEQGIRDAIAAGGGPYTFDCDGSQTVVTQAKMVVDNDVILDGGGNLTVDGNGTHPLFSVESVVTAELRGFTVAKGASGLGAGYGGGIENAGTLALTNSTVSGNAAGGIENFGTLALTNSTVSGNFGVGIWTGGGPLTLTNSTVSGNTQFGIVNPEGSGKVTLTNSTVSGSIFRGADALLTLTNSLVDGECQGDITSSGYNIESPGDTCGFDQATDQVNVSTEDLNLGPLRDNGGPTMTHKPGDRGFGPYSVAIDQIPGTACEVTTDQRGEPRPEMGGTMCDVGSVEVQP